MFSYLKSASVRVTMFLVFLPALICCSKSSSNGGSTPIDPPPAPPPVITSEMQFYKTTANQATLLAKQNVSLVFGTTANQFPTITIDSTQVYQTMDGFGYTLTGGSAQLINGLSTPVKQSLLKELFATDSSGIGISYLRISIGASDLNSTVYTYNDLPTGQTDVNLQNFSLDRERLNMIPLLKQILAINPNIRILGSPWTAPVWMKTNNSSIGGKLQSQYYSVYASYLVKFVQQMKVEGITIDALTPQNEPLNPLNNPSMEMTATEQADFIKNHLGPKLKSAALNTKIIIYDHNADRPDYPLTVLSDASARSFIDGTGFHLYAGNISALTPVHDAYPDKNIYFTEQYTASTGTFSGDLSWHVKNLVVGASRNWSKNVLEWNLANDPSYGPHTPGGCTVCLGAITINGDNIQRNVAYYIIAHASKFVKAGAQRIASNIVGNLQNVAFLMPDGRKAIIVLNDSQATQSFNISIRNRWVTATLEAGAVGTFTW